MQNTVSSRIKFVREFVLFIVLISCHFSSLAATIEVTAQIGDLGCDLVEAIEAANSDDPVGGCVRGVGDDTIVLNFSVPISEFVVSSVNNTAGNGTGLPTIRTGITILGRGAEKVIIKRSDAPSIPDFRLFYVTQSGHLSLDNVSVRNGKLPNVEGEGLNVGAAAYVQGGRLDVSGSDFIDNQAFGAGALYTETVNDSPPNLMIRDTRFQNNQTTGPRSGGAIQSTGGKITLIDSEFTGNQSMANGGAIHAILDNELIIRTTLFTNNTAEKYGGAIYVSLGATVSIYDSTISGNTATTESGGGIAVGGDSDVTVSVTNTTITNNAALSGNGGGIDIFSFATFNDSSFSIVNSLISDNTGGFACCSGQEIASGTEDNILSISHSLIGHAGITTAQAVRGGATIHASNIFATSDGDSPTAINNILQPLANNGGLTRTHALSPNSPAIDAATDGTVVQVFIFTLYIPGCRGEELAPAAPLPAFRLDQRGIRRPIGGACDIGSYEEEDPGGSQCFVVKAANQNVFAFCL